MVNILKDKLNCKWSNKFFYSSLYLGCLAVLIYLSWILNNPVIGLATISVFGTITLIFSEDITPTMALLVMACCIFATDDIGGYVIYVLVLIPLIIAIGLHFVLYPRKLKLGKMFFPQLAVSIVLILAGVGTIAIKNYFSTFFYCILLGLVILIFYVLYYTYYTNEKVDKQKYFAKILFWFGLLMCAQIIGHYIKNAIPVRDFGKEWIHLGWGIDNNVATLLLLTAPFTFYLATKEQKLTWLYTFFGLLQYAVIVLTFSRGGILFAILTAPFVIGITAKKASKKQVLVPIVICFAMAMLVYFQYFDTINNMVSSMFKGISDGSGEFSANRNLLYKEALDVFAKFPINGAGMGYAGNNFDTNVVGFYWFHSTFFQIIASMGLIGLTGYLYFYIIRYKIIVRNAVKNLFGMFSLLAMIGFELYSMIDTGTFIPVPIMILTMLITLINERQRKDNGRQKL